MSQYVIVGGSNGIGLSLALELIKRGNFVYILDVASPDSTLKEYESSYSYIKFNLLDFDEETIMTLNEENNIEGLILTAGIGRIATFNNLHLAEINKLFTINTIGIIKIIKLFYDKILRNDSFYCAVMGSIAGMINSPLFSVYGASKAALCRFIESVNVELEIADSPNRILNVSPGHIKGTKFDGGENKTSENTELVKQVLQHMYDRKLLFIPEYEDVYSKVLQRYHQDSHQFGLQSYEYKMKSGRIKQGRGAIVGYLSGTFDLFHVGHLNLLQRAKEKCDYLIVGVHPDASHKGKETFISFEERMKIVSAIKYVDKVVPSCREDSDAWDLWHYNRLFVGSDYKGTERFNRYEEYFKDKGVEIVYFPYTDGTSSTQLRSLIDKKIKE